MQEPIENSMCYADIFDKEVYLKLSIDSQIKVEHIYHIAYLLAINNMISLSQEDFDRLYDHSNDELEKLSIEASNLLGK